MSNIELTVTARTYREIQAEIKELEARADALKQQMIHEMDARDTEELAAGEYTIRWGLYESSRLDSAKLMISDRPIEYPFRYWNYAIDPPAGMSRRKYRETLMQLQILENMRFAAFAHGVRYTAADIRRYTGKSFINLFELWQVAEFQIFGTAIPPEYYAFLLDMDTAEPMIAAYHVGPIHIKLL